MDSRIVWPKLSRFNGDSNPEVWAFQAEQYFDCYKILPEYQLSVASFYLDGNALEWYRWLFRNKQLLDWPHFVQKLLIHYRTQNRESHDTCFTVPQQPTIVKHTTTNPAKTITSHLLGLLRQMDENLSLMRRQLDNIQNSMSTCTDTFTNAQACLDEAESPREAEEVEDSMTDSILLQGHSSPMDDSEVLTHLDSPIGESSPTVPLAFLEVSNGCIGPYPLQSKNKEEECTSDHAYKVFATIPDWKIDLKIDASAKNNSVTAETQVFDKVFPSVSVVRSEASDLIMFDNQLALRCMSFVRSSNKLICNGISDYSSKFGQIVLVLLLHRFPPGPVGLQFPFDPDSCGLTISSGGVHFSNRISYVTLSIVQLNGGLNKTMPQGMRREFDVLADELSSAPVPVIEFVVVVGHPVPIRVFEYSSHGLEIEFPRRIRVSCGGQAYEVLNEMKNYPSLENTRANPFTVLHGGTATAIFIWDPGKCYLFMALTGYPIHLTPQQLLGCPTMFFLIMCANYMIKVWDPGWQLSVCVYILQFYPTLSGINSLTFYQMFTMETDILTKLASRVTVLIPSRKELIFLLALPAQHILQSLGMNVSEKCGLKVIAWGCRSYLIEFYFERMPRANYYGLCKILHSLFSMNLLYILEFVLSSTIVDFYLSETYNSGYSKHYDDAIKIAHDYFSEVFALLSVDRFRELEFHIISFKTWMELYLSFVVVGVIGFDQASKFMLALSPILPDVNPSIRRRAIQCLSLSFVVNALNKPRYCNSSPIGRDDATLMVAIPVVILLELITPKLVFIQECNILLRFISWAVCGGHKALLKEVILELILIENLIRAMSIANVLHDVHSQSMLGVHTFWNGALNFDQVKVVDAYPPMPSLLGFLDWNLEDKVLIEGGSNVMNGPELVLANGSVEESSWALEHNQPNVLLMGFIWDPG